MRYLIASLCCGVILSLPLAAWAGDDAPTKPKDYEKWMSERKQIQLEEIKRVDKIVSLTADQKKKMEKIYDDENAELRKFQQENYEKVNENDKAIAEARKRNDSGATSRASEELYRLYAPLAAKVKAHAQERMDLLTADQTTKWVDYNVTDMAKNIVSPLVLTDAQMEKIKKDYRQTNRDIFAFDYAYIKERVKELLTDEQKSELRKINIERYTKLFTEAIAHGGVTLTDEQVKKVQAICNAVPKDSVLESEFQHDVVPKLYNVLTQAQKDFLRKASAKENARSLSRPA